MPVGRTPHGQRMLWDRHRAAIGPPALGEQPCRLDSGVPPSKALNSGSKGVAPPAPRVALDLHVQGLCQRMRGDGQRLGFVLATVIDICM